MRGKRLNYPTYYYRTKLKTLTVRKEVAEELARICHQNNLTYSDCIAEIMKKVSDYQKQINDYQKQLSDYQARIKDYESALRSILKIVDEKEKPRIMLALASHRIKLSA